MAKSLATLNDHLFAQLDRLSAKGLQGDALDAEVKRAGAIVDIADQITGTADLQLKAAKLFADHGKGVLPMLPQIADKTGEPE